MWTFMKENKSEWALCPLIAGHPNSSAGPRAPLPPVTSPGTPDHAFWSSGVDRVAQWQGVSRPPVF